jgi:tetratricopeptide (TPR) repeat protein
MRRISSPSLALAFIGGPSAPPRPRPPSPPNRADSLFQRQDWPAAHRAYVALTAAEPTNGRYWYRRGYAEYQAKDYQAAVQSWTKAEAIGHNATVMYNLAVGHALLNGQRTRVRLARQGRRSGVRTGAAG